MTARVYHSPARDQAKEDTRQAILRAVVRVVLDDGVHAFTIENVAIKAGVSARTVYRHFATREELLEGLSASLDDIASRAGAVETPATPEALVTMIAPVYREFARQRDAVTASVIATFALRLTPRGRKERSRQVRTLVRRSFPSLEPEVLEEAGAMVVSIASSVAWLQLTSEARLPDARAARAVTWALRTLFADLARRERSGPID